ncbi:complex I intermediate-associated protein 30-domain-containing protein [Stachybotrys elegans]|uniref:Complex I intermediate-associated protein 30-domain-containing protein n=1 Tax=Stachybotrys elegans TaxID=80388 RepID=A0A8K0SJ26_9HYPO|nr:complex I intermediate-associated protein 30-domain-containing protein [Stachybotrys elegans]
MRAAQPLLAKGFISRSMAELKRRTSIVTKLEPIKGATTPRPLYNFDDEASVRDSIRMSDSLIGGSSQVAFDFVPSSADNPAPHARFHGSISVALPADRPKVQRSGYAGFRTPDQPATMFGNSLWDIDPYMYLAMRIKSDGRAYFINVQTEGVEPTDLHQHRLFAKRPGQWETVLVKWNEFVRTNHGFVVEPQTELLRQKVRTVGIGLTDRVEGPFELCIERIWATNNVKEEREGLPSKGSGGQLRNRKGEKVQW